MVAVTSFSQSEILNAILDFFQHRRPQFTPAVAVDIVRSLSQLDRSDRKGFAVALRQEFAARGFRLQHTHALDLTARLLGFTSWPQASHTLDHLTVWYPDGLSRNVGTWDEALDLVQQRCLEIQGSSRELALQADSRGLSLTLRFHGSEVSPAVGLIAAVNVIESGSPRTWHGARSALEGLRRRLEESRRFFIDGYTVARLCSRDYQGVKAAYALHLPDAGSSELVLLRQDHPDEAHEMIEIARGDELECFAQLENALDQAPGTLEIHVVEDAWIVRGGRYRWALSTLRPNDYVPGLGTHFPTEAEYSKLKHRYQLAREIFRQPVPRHSVRKQLADIDGPRERYRVNQHAMLLALNQAGLTWESYCAKYAEESLHELTNELPLWAIMDFANRIAMPDINMVFARPTRADLVRVETDEILRALYQRVDHVTYRVSTALDRDEREIVGDIVREFSESLHAYMLIRAGVVQLPPSDLSHLAWIDDARTLFERTREAGFTLHAGRTPRLFSINGIDLPEGMAPFAFGHSLYLDFGLEGY